jgi:hypothetical protein
MPLSLRPTSKPKTYTTIYTDHVVFINGKERTGTHPCEHAHAWNAVSTTSVILCDVSTLPPTTAALSLGDRKQPLGILIETGARQPWFSGMSIST